MALLDHLRREMAIVVVTHDLSMAPRADQVVVMAGGRIQAVGSHAELLRTTPPYRQLVEQEHNSKEEMAFS